MECQPRAVASTARTRGARAAWKAAAADVALRTRHPAAPAHCAQLLPPVRIAGALRDCLVGPAPPCTAPLAAARLGKRLCSWAPGGAVAQWLHPRPAKLSTVDRNHALVAGLWWTGEPQWAPGSGDRGCSSAWCVERLSVETGGAADPTRRRTGPMLGVGMPPALRHHFPLLWPASATLCEPPESCTGETPSRALICGYGALWSSGYDSGLRIAVPQFESGWRRW